LASHGSKTRNVSRWLRTPRAHIDPGFGLAASPRDACVATRVSIGG
jgi:hypothetical protein